jgi:hypothetical protein
MITALAKCLVLLSQLLVLLLPAFTGHAQSTPCADVACRNRITTQVNAMSAAFLQKDYDAFAQFMYPEIVKLAGGTKAIAAELRKGSTKMEAEGLKVTSVKSGEPSGVIIAPNGDLQSTLLQTTEMLTPERTMTFKSTLVAVSTDQGQHWYFLDTAGKDSDTVRKSFPNISSALKFGAPN